MGLFWGSHINRCCIILIPSLLAFLTRDFRLVGTIDGSLKRCWEARVTPSGQDSCMETNLNSNFQFSMGNRHSMFTQKRGTYVHTYTYDAQHFKKTAQSLVLRTYPYPFSNRMYTVNKYSRFLRSFVSIVSSFSKCRSMQQSNYQKHIKATKEVW